MNEAGTLVKTKCAHEDINLLGDSHEEAYWECSDCGETLDPDENNLENPATEWLSGFAEQVELQDDYNRSV